MKKRRQHHEEEHIDETWLIPYADLLTLLLALFIILFASSQIDSQKFDRIMQSLNSAFTGGSGFFEPSTIVPVFNQRMDQPKNEGTLDERTRTPREEELFQKFQKELADMEELKQQLDQYIEENNLGMQLETKLNSEMLLVTIRDHALFASGSADVRPEAASLGLAISAMLAQYPEYTIEVGGHTDNIPIHTREFESNWELGSKRALNFMKILQTNTQHDPGRFKPVGYGEYHPVDTNATFEGRAKNRRVEVAILRTVTNESIFINASP